MKAGVHCSVRNGFVAALEEAAALRCDTLQIFTQSPRGWKTRVYTDDEFSAFRKAREKHGFDPVIVHSPYLPNLSTSDPDLYRLSLNCLKQDYARCEKLGAEYLVIHPGAYSPGATRDEGLKHLIAALNETLSSGKAGVRILIENMAGGGRRIGGDFKEIGFILNAVKKTRLIGVCFDTCHALAAGYDISHPAGVETTLGEVERTVGLSAVEVFHANDSKGALGSHRDMHQHLGEGHVGEAGLRYLFGTPAVKGCAFVLETPKEPVPRADVENLKTLRSYLAATRPDT